MKRYVKSQETLPKHYSLIYGGIYIDSEDNIRFNWDSDKCDDILMLCKDMSGEFDKNGIRYIYGYEFNPSSKGHAKSAVRSYLKKLGPGNHLFDENVEDFVENGIFKIEAFCPFDFFDAKISVEPTSDSLGLIDVMDQYIAEYCRCAWYDFKLIKETYEHVNFDFEKARSILVELGWSTQKIDKQIRILRDKFEELKVSGELFQMKRFIPREIRQSITDFLKFKTDKERTLYSSLQGANILIYDDFYTSGSTVNEIIRYLHSINDSNTLTVFILVKQ